MTFKNVFLYSHKENYYYIIICYPVPRFGGKYCIYLFFFNFFFLITLNISALHPKYMLNVLYFYLQLIHYFKKTIFKQFYDTIKDQNI